jgi:hypothetical protein
MKTVRAKSADDKLKEIKGSLIRAISETEADDRLKVGTATIEENAPLALVQCVLGAQVRTLKFLLKKFEEEGLL